MGGKTVRVGLKNLKVEFLGHRQVTLPVQFLCPIELGCRVHPGLKPSILVRRYDRSLCFVFPDMWAASRDRDEDRPQAIKRYQQFSGCHAVSQSGDSAA